MCRRNSGERPGARQLVAPSDDGDLQSWGIGSGTRAMVFYVDNDLHSNGAVGDAVTGLSDGTTYEFEVAAINGAGGVVHPSWSEFYFRRFSADHSNYLSPPS